MPLQTYISSSSHVLRNFFLHGSLRIILTGKTLDEGCCNGWRSFPVFLQNYYLSKAMRPGRNSISYQLFFHIAERCFGHGCVDFSPMCSFLLKSCAGKPAWDIFQDREEVYPEGPRDCGFINSIQGFFGE